MSIELDHLFVCADPGAPEATELIKFGLCEGPPNRHPGQGTANRRFPLANAMIELIWVYNPQEAQSGVSRRTLLWERWSSRESGTSPFGICLRPADSQNPVPPFPAWEYRPGYLADGQTMHIGHAGIEEPMWVYLGFVRRAFREQQFQEHPNGVREITGLALTTLVPLTSSASQKAIKSGVLSAQTGLKPLLEIQFDGERHGKFADFRPQMPIIFRF
jgi:hypothetical protein